MKPRFLQTRQLAGLFLNNRIVRDFSFLYISLFFFPVPVGNGKKEIKEI